MNCLPKVLDCLSYALEQLGLYEPEISAQEARERLSLESELWKNSQYNRNKFWNKFQANNATIGQLPSLVERAITHLKNHNIQKGIAVDLGCGINTTTFNLLERGWKVYAVDSSDSVIKTLEKQVSSMGKSWIKDKQLILVNQAIEEFEYPEKIHLVIAIHSLPYCDPKKIDKIFFEAKNALLPQGLLACNLFPYNDNPIADSILRGMFGGWTTTKNVVEAVIRSVDFSSWSVTEGKSPSGTAQFHIFAKR